MSKPGKRSRLSPTLARLPRRGYVIQEKHLRRFRSLALRPDTTYAGLVHMGEDGNEIWVEAGLSEAEKRFTIVHELVHARRQRGGEELADERLEEAIVELETVSRVGGRTLTQMPSGLSLSMLHDYLTGGHRHDPNTRAGLRAIHRRIWAMLGGRRARWIAPALSLPARRRRDRPGRRRPPASRV